MSSTLNIKVPGDTDNIVSIAEILTEVLQESANGVIVLDNTLRVILWNHWIETASAINKADAVGNNFIALFPELANKRIHNAIVRALDNGVSSLLSPALTTHPLPLYDKNNNYEPIKQIVHIKPIVTSDGCYCLLQINDATAALKREYQLRRAIKHSEVARETAENLADMKSSFISTVSHELRTPLTSILGSLRLLDSGVIDDIPEQAKTLIGISYRNSERLLLLINDILDMEKIEAGQMKFQFEPLDITQLVQRSIEEISAYAQTLGVSYYMNAEGLDGLMVVGDKSRLIQVMNNLLSNAAKHEPKGGDIEVSIRQFGDRVRVTVTDHGPGIPESFRNVVFEKFSQADFSGTKKHSGTGLGLAIAKSIIDEHKGILNFDTELGKGTSFYFELNLSYYS